jgi:hypothetical protein
VAKQQNVPFPARKQTKIARSVLVTALRELAKDAEDRGNAADESAKASSIAPHRANFLGERAAEWNAATRFGEWADEIEAS